MRRDAKFVDVGKKGGRKREREGRRERGKEGLLEAGQGSEVAYDTLLEKIYEVQKKLSGKIMRKMHYYLNHRKSHKQKSLMKNIEEIY